MFSALRKAFVGDSSVHGLAEAGNVKELEKLIKEDHNQLNAQDKDGLTPLSCAAKSNKPEAVSFLLKSRAFLGIADKSGWTCVHWAAFSKSNACLKLLLEKANAPINDHDKEGRTPLMRACEKRATDCMKSLLDAGASTRITDKQGKTAMDLAKQWKYDDVIKVLEDAKGTTVTRTFESFGGFDRRSPRLTAEFESMSGFRPPSPNSHLTVKTVHKSSSSSDLSGGGFQDDFFKDDPFFSNTSRGFHSKLHGPDLGFSSSGFGFSTTSGSFPDAKEEVIRTTTTTTTNKSPVNKRRRDFDIKEKGTKTPGHTPPADARKADSTEAGRATSGGRGSESRDADVPSIVVSAIKQPATSPRHGQPKSRDVNKTYVRREREEIENTQTDDEKQAAGQDDEPPEIFLSYQWDHQETVQQVYQHLTESGYSCWMDIYQIKPGDDLQVKMQSGIRNAKVVLSFLTLKYLKSKNCEHEVTFADEFQKPIIPIRLEAVERSSFPDGIFRAAIPHRIIYIDLMSIVDEKSQTFSTNEDVTRLMESIKKHVLPQDKNMKSTPSTMEDSLLDPASIEYVIDKSTNSRESLGGGGNAQVYKGYFHTYKTNCAVKIFHSGLTLPDSVRKQIESEALKMMRIRSKHVVQVYGVLMNDAAREYGIVMEYYTFGSLVDFMEYVTFPHPLKVQIARDIAFGMTFLHVACKLLHRDLKAQNILLDESFAPKISDFDQARFDHATATITRREPTGGSISHMAPEELDPPEDYQPSVYSDVWGFGVTLYQICADKDQSKVSPMKRLPFPDSMTPAQIIAMVGVKRKGPINQKKIQEKIPEDCPQVLINMMLQCCNVVPADRPRFPDLLEDLQDAMVQKYQTTISQDMSYLKKQYYKAKEMNKK